MAGATSAKESLAAELSRVPLFAGLSPAQLADMSRVVQRRTYRADEVIFYQGDAGDKMYLIAAGQVKVTVTSADGDEVILTVLDAGECFGELSLLDAQPRSATVQTTQHTDVLVLQRSSFVQFLRQAPDVAIRLLGVLSGRLRATDQLVQDAVFLDVAARLAKKLLGLAETHGRPVGDGVEIDMHLTQQDLASMIGATRESVNKQLSLLRDRGLLTIDRQRIMILKPQALHERIGAA